jgi:hypothetical protein
MFTDNHTPLSPYLAQFLTHMRTHVYAHAVFSAERLSACLTDMRLLTRMGQHVRSQVVSRRASVATGGALIWFIPRMRPYVPMHATGMREPLATCLTDMRLLS